MRIFLERIPGGGKQALDGGDEDEHDEGAHQVGLEDLVPHLGVLQQEREDRGREEKDEEAGLQTDATGDAPRHGDTCNGSTTSSFRERDRQEREGRLGGPGGGARPAQR